MASPILTAAHTPPPQASSLGILRFIATGNVDDGKSTLIGRLLYDSHSIYEDQLASVRNGGINRSAGFFDLSLITDGLRAEREQGITIDVAYRHFSTPRRRFIIADTPGHEQYIRNMATGASTADAAVVLIDAVKGLMPQCYRHTCIAALFGIQNVIAAVNKIDLVDYSEIAFRAIAEKFTKLANQLGIQNVYSVPVSALRGDNVITASAETSWFSGPPLLTYLETLPQFRDQALGPLRFPVQYVICPDSGFRGFAGQIASGILRRGDKLQVWPSGLPISVKSIIGFDTEQNQAQAGDSITITLGDQIDLTRGDLVADFHQPPTASTRIAATLIWMNADQLRPEKPYLLKHTTRTVCAYISKVNYCMDFNSLEAVSTKTLKWNDVGSVEIETTVPIFFDSYRRIRATGSFILIDPVTNATVAAGMIEAANNSSAQGCDRFPLSALLGLWLRH